MLGQIVIHDQDIGAFGIHQFFCHRAAGIGCQILQRGGRAGTGDHNRGVVHRAAGLQNIDNRSHCRHFLADRHVNAINLLAALIQNRIDCQGCFTGLPVADNQFALAAADRGHGVDRRDAGLQRLIDHLPINDRQSSKFDGSPRFGDNRAESVHRMAQRVDDTAEQSTAGRYLDRCPRALADNAFTDRVIFLQHDDTDAILLQVHGNTAGFAGKLDQLVAAAILQPAHNGDAVAVAEHLANFIHRRR